MQSAILPQQYLFIHPSVVHLPMTLRYCDPIGRNSSKIISRLVSLGYLLSADPNITDLLQGEHPKFWPEYEWGTQSGFWCTKALISLKCSNIGPRLLLRTNRKSHTLFRLASYSTTLDDLEGSLCTLFQNVHLHHCYLFILSFTFNLLLVIYDCRCSYGIDLSEPEAHNYQRVWTILSHSYRLIQWEIVWSQVLLDSLHPRSLRTSWWFPPVLGWRKNMPHYAVSLRLHSFLVYETVS